MHPLAEKIDSLQRHLVLRERAFAAAAVGATIIGVALLLGSIDYFVRLDDPGLRIMATTALTAAGLWAVYHWWYSRARNRFATLSVARRVETRFPQLQDSLASALEFLQQSEDDRTAGSAQLRRHVVTEAQTAVEGLPLDAVIDRRPLRRATTWLAIALAAVALCLVIDARAVGTAIARLASPLGTAEWPRQHHLEFCNPPTRLAAGQTFEAELIDSAGELPDDVRIEYRIARNGRRESVSDPMTRVGDVMVARRENVQHSFAFRAEGGDDRNMRWQLVEVVEPPQLETLSITVHPPAYTGLLTARTERHLNVLAGTGIELNGTASEPLASARIMFEGSEPIVATIHSDSAGNEKRAFHTAPEKWIAAKSGTYQLELADMKGLSAVVGQWNLRTDADSAPSIA